MKNHTSEFILSKTWLVNILLLLSDLLGFLISFGFITWVRKFILQVNESWLIDPQVIRTSLIIVGSTLLMFWIKGLYPGRGRISVIELKQIIESTAIAWAIVSVYIFIDSRLYYFSRSVYVLIGLFSIGIIFVGRIFIRKLLVTKTTWWGEPVVIIGTNNQIVTIVKRLDACRRLGYRPVIALSVDSVKPAKFTELKGLHVTPWTLSVQDQVVANQIRTVILAISTNELRQQYPLIYHSIGLKFSKTIFILDNDIYGSMMAQPIDLNGQPAILSHQSLFSTSLRFLKWVFEILLLVLLIVPVLGLCLIVAILIKIDSKGPVFYSHTRIGKDLKPFLLVKFRTMHVNSDEIFSEVMRDPEVQVEWNTYHKLTDDPRITRVGRFLRKFSIDEIPQFFNILRGEMNLIGPRPLVLSEIEKMGELANIVFRVRPGLTGWWQVNGRNNLSFEERTQLDVYYVFNWSLWLDIYIVIKTIWVIVFKNSG